MPSIAKFQKEVLTYYAEQGRSFPWRTTRDPYKILVSEIMLQQTQAPRVIEKYASFLQRFPTIETLARAPRTKVLKEWQGLGYNRRGLALKKTAEIIMSDFKGKIPKDYNALLSLPGVGPATAGDIMAFAWNMPAIVIETNIRAVFLHFFFPEKNSVPDGELLPLITKSLPANNAREWYYALMDYGAMLKKKLPNPSRRSRHYAQQSPFKGSNREQRSKILKYILAYPKQDLETITEALDIDPAVIKKNISAMVTEGLILKKTLNGKTLYL